MKYYHIKKNDLKWMSREDFEPYLDGDVVDRESVYFPSQEKYAEDFIEDITELESDIMEELTSMYKLSEKEIKAKLHSGEFVPDIEGNLITCDFVEGLKWIENYIYWEV